MVNRAMEERKLKIKTGTRRVQIKKDKTSEETHARSGSVWKVPNQAGLKSKLPGPGGSAATRV